MELICNTPYMLFYREFDYLYEYDTVGYSRHRRLNNWIKYRQLYD